MSGGTRPDRMRRVDEALREVLAEAVRTEIKDPRVGFATVTSVRTSADLRHAKVAVSVLGDEDQRTETLAGLRSAHGYLQRRVADELHLRNTPALQFLIDEGADRAERIQRLIDAEAPDALVTGPSGAEAAGGAGDADGGDGR